MKNLITTLLLLAAPVFLFAQTKSIEKFYEKYVKHEKASTIDLEGGIFKLNSKETDENGNDIWKNISQLRLLIMEDGNLVDKRDSKQLMDDVRKESFEDLLSVRDEGDNVNILVREDGDRITNLLLLVDSEDEFVMLSLEGAIRLSDLKELDIDFEGMEHLKKL